MIHTPPLSHRIVAWVMNLALGVWVLEALGVFVAVIFIARGGEGGDVVTRIIESHSLSLLVAQGIATCVAVLCVLLRHSLHAESLVQEERSWMASLLLLLLAGSTVYILVVGARDFQANRIIERQVDRRVTQEGKPMEMETYYREYEVEASEVRQSYKEASAELSVVVSLGAFSAAGILILHFLGWREERDRGRGRRRGRVPPWRAPKNAS